MTLAITGARGLVGTHLAVEAAHAGWQVRALARGEPPCVEGVNWVPLPSLDDTEALEHALRGCTHVVHLAARVHMMSDPAPDPLAEYRKVNVEGTRHVLDAAIRVGARRFLFMSTVKVHGEGSTTPYTPADPTHPEGPYAVSKLEAEKVVEARSDRIETVTIRSPLVYGPGVRANFERLIRLTKIARWVPLPLAGMSNRRSLVFVGNLADAILHLLSAPGAPGRTFLVSDGEDLSTPELVRRIGRAVGMRPRLFSVPTGLLRVLARATGREAEISRLDGSLVVDPSDLLATGWVPPFSVDEGLRWTVGGSPAASTRPARGP